MITPQNVGQWLDFLNPGWRSQVDTINTDSYKDMLLETMLKKTVPLWYLELRECSLEYIKKEQNRIAGEIGSKGDLLLFGSKKKGQAAEIFNDFAKGVTILAMLADGGVDCFGHWDLPSPTHWETEQEIYKYDF